jgi:hypothetical protein
MSFTLCGLSLKKLQATQGRDEVNNFSFLRRRHLAFYYMFCGTGQKDAMPMRPRIYRPKTFFSGSIRPLGDASLGRCVPWTIIPLNDAFVTDLSRDWTAYTWWIIPKAGRRKLGFIPVAMGQQTQTMDGPRDV